MTEPGEPGHVTVAHINGRSTVVRDGTPIGIPYYCDWSTNTEWIDHFLASGVRVYGLHLKRDGYDGRSSFWGENAGKERSPTDEGFILDRQAEYILQKQPDALFIVRFNMYPPPDWIEKHPDDMPLTSDGQPLKVWRPTASLASTSYLKAVRRYLNNLVSYCEAKGWASRVIGYHVFPTDEGIKPIAFEHFFDHSQLMRDAWHGWLKKTYPTDAALRQAWGREEVSRDQAPVPHVDVLRQKVRQLPQWPPPSALRMERDYVLLQRELFTEWMRTILNALAEATAARPAFFGLDGLKQHMLGFMTSDLFQGHSQHAEEEQLSFFLASGSIDVGHLLDHPRLGCMVTPACYHARGMGMGFEGEGLMDSLNLRGKFLHVENDARTYLSGEGPKKRPMLGTFMNPREVRAGLLRNTGMCLSRGAIPYWCDVGGGWFNDGEIQKQIQLDKRVLEAGMLRPHRETEHAIAVIVDDRSPLYENFTMRFQHLALIQQRIRALAFCGIPYRIYLLSDLSRDDFSDYRCFLFPNLFKVDDKVIALLRAKVFGHGRVAIFGPGTGITDGQEVHATGAEKLLGIPMEVRNEITCARTVRIRNRSHPALQARGMVSSYGDGLPYGPLLVPDPTRLQGTDVQVLGDCVAVFGVNTAGLALKEFGRGASGNGAPGERGPEDYAVVFTCAIPLPAPLLRGLARYGGCNVWCDDDVVLAASESVLMLHSTERGPFTVQLPCTFARVIDASAEKTVFSKCEQFTVELDPPETRVYFLD